MTGPWEKYQQPVAGKPWEKYQQQPPPETVPDLYKEGPAQPVNVEESPVDSAGRGMGNAMLLGGAPYIGGAVEYAMQGGAPGSFDEGYNRSEQASQSSEKQNPTAYGAGAGAGVAMDAALTGGPALLQGGRMLAQSPQAARWILSGLWRMSGLPGGGLFGAAADVAPTLARAYRTGRAAEQAAPASGALSAEMKAALKRGKFRHQYRTGL